MIPTFIIPAKGTSKGIPRKNITYLEGTPLIGWTLRAIELTSLYGPGTVIVSTDCSRVEGVVQRNYDNFVTVHKRSDALAKDDVHSFSVVLDILNSFPISDDTPVFMLLPTSPLRTPMDIRHSLGLLKKKSAVIGVTKVGPLHSMRTWDRASGYIKPIVDFGMLGPNRQRQGAPFVYKVNGAVFLAHAGTLRQQGTFHVPSSIPYPMPWYRSIDVNNYNDLRFCREVIQKKIGFHEDEDR